MGSLKGTGLQGYGYARQPGRLLFSQGLELNSGFYTSPLTTEMPNPCTQLCACMWYFMCQGNLKAREGDRRQRIHQMFIKLYFSGRVLAQYVQGPGCNAKKKLFLGLSPRCVCVSIIINMYTYIHTCTHTHLEMDYHFSPGCFELGISAKP